MKTFLEEVVDHVLARHKDDLEDICLVIPGRRPSIFIRKYLSDAIGKEFWSPDILGIQEFVRELTGKSVSDSTEILLKLYDYFRKDSFFERETFDEFLIWAPMALADFSEIDNYLKDAKVIFQNLKNIKEIDEWSFNESPLSAEQEKFNSFWQHLGLRYEKTQEFLKEEGIYYSAMLMRELAENIEVLAANNKWKKIYFIGFNAMSNAEIKITDYLVSKGKSEMLWDADAYYTNNKVQEAGLFLRRHKKRSENFLWERNNLLEHKKDLHFHQCSSEFLQIKKAGLVLDDLDPDSSIAILLTDESLLLPLLQSIHPKHSEMNISMGYPLTQTSFYSFTKLVFEIAHAVLKNPKKGVYHKDFERFVNHSFIQMISTREEKILLDSIIEGNKKRNLAFLDSKDLKKKDKQSEILSFFRNLSQVKMESIIEYFDLLIDLAIERKSLDPVTRETVFEFHKIFGKIKEISREYNFIDSLKTFESFLDQLVASASLSFYGDPIKGIQITGILESRALDFDQVLILGANEGLLPKKKKTNSFIPYELKKYFQLPTFEEQDAVFAYYFYRLLQRSSRVDLFYTMQSDVFGSTEPSRFIEQIKEEIDSPEVELHSHKHFTKLMGDIQISSGISNSKELQERIIEKLERGISPSGLNTFLRCPMDFYFKQVLGLREMAEVEEEIQLNTFGTIVHEVLEDFYKEVVGEKLTLDHLEDWKKRLEEQTKKVFEEVFESSFIEEGFNFLSFKVALTYLKNFLKQEKKYLEQLIEENLSLEIVALEEWVDCVIPLEINGRKIQLRIHGMVDRIDKVGGRTRIIDYKSGGVQKSDLGIDGLGSIVTNSKPKVLQLLVYKLAYAMSNNVPWANIDSGIISLKNIQNGTMLVHPNTKYRGEDFVEEIEKEFPVVLKEIVQMMLDPESIWVHNSDSDFCEYCEN